MAEWLPAPWSLVAAVAGGALLATLYLGVLWLSVRRMPAARHPLAWMLASGVARLALVLGGLWALSGGRTNPLLAGLAGFLAMRIALTGWLRTGRGPGLPHGERSGERAP